MQTVSSVSALTFCAHRNRILYS